MWTIMWTENSQDRWDRLETKEEVMQLLDSLDKNSVLNTERKEFLCLK